MRQSPEELEQARCRRWAVKGVLTALKRDFRDTQSTDISTPPRLVHLVPIGDVRRRLFDHFVSLSEQRWRHGEAERLGSLEVDDQIKLRWGLHRQVARLLSLEDSVDGLLPPGELPSA